MARRPNQSVLISAQLVALDGHRLKLDDGPERAAAVELMVARGMSTTEIAERLGLTPAHLGYWCRTNGIALTPKPRAHWTVDYVGWDRKRKANQKARKAAKAD
jgi:transposase